MGGGMDLCHQCLQDGDGGCIFTARLHEACIWQTRHLLSPEKQPQNFPPVALHWSWHCFRNSKAASSQPLPDTRHKYLVHYTFFFPVGPRRQRRHCGRAPLQHFRLQTIESSGSNMRSPPDPPWRPRAPSPLLPRRSCCARAPATLCRGMRRDVRRGVCLCSSRYARSSRWAELVAARESEGLHHTQLWDPIFCPTHFSFFLSQTYTVISTFSQWRWDEASLISHSWE